MLAATRRLAIDRVTVEVVSAFDAADLPSILLKGVSIARWLYPRGGRSYRDTDLLVPAHRFAEAEAILGDLGFTPRSGFTDRDVDPERTARAYGRAQGPGPVDVVDLHVNLPHLDRSDDELWQLLYSHSEVIALGAAGVRVLDHIGLALHIALHAVHHEFEFHTSEDLRRAIGSLTIEEWGEVCGLARQLDVVDVVAFALRHDAAGAVIADRLELAERPMDDTCYWPKFAPPGAEALTKLRSAHTPREVMALVRERVLPTARKVRHYYRLGPAQPRRALVVAYLRWWGHVIASLWPAVRYVTRPLAHRGRTADSRDG